MRQVADETRQLATLERAQLALSRTLIENQQAAARTEKERAAFASQRAQISLRAAEAEYAATTKQLAAQKELAAAQVKIAADRVRAADAAMKQALVVTNAMRSEKAAAEQGLQIEIQKARAQYQSINNLKQIAGLERQATVAALDGVEAANRRAQAAANKARADAQMFAAFRDMDRETQQRQAESSRAQLASQQQMMAGMTSLRNMAISAAAALGAVGTVQIAGNIISAGQEAELTRRRINATAGELGEVAGIYEIAARGAQQFAIANIDSQAAVANLYNRLRPMGVSLNQIETVYTGVNNAVLLGGLSAYDGAEAFRQLGQAMGSGRLQGDELRSLMERMPAIGVALAKVMGVSVGEIKKLGSDGKITTDIIIKATEELAKLKPPEPTPVQRYTAAVKDLSTALGEELLPKVTPVIMGLTDLVNGFAKNAEHILDVVSMPAIGLAKTFAVLMGVIRGEPEVIVAEWKKLDEIAQQAKVSAVNRKLAEEGAAAAVSQYGQALSSIAPQAEQLAATKERQAAIEKEITDRMNQQYDQVVRINEAATARINERRDAAQNILNVEQAQIGVARAILEQKQSLAQTEVERKEIAQQIADLEYRSAQVNYNAIIAQIDAEKQLEQIRVINAENEFRRATEAYNIALRYGKITADLTMAREQARSKLIVAAVENRAFDASVKARTQVANLNLQASGINAGYDPGTAAAMAGGGTTNQASGGKVTVRQNKDGSFNISNQVSGFAAGGHVRGPTLAWVGEGGEGESIVPDSKRMGFARNVLAGVTGAAAIPRFATGGYVQGYQHELARGGGWLPNNRVSTFKQGTKVVNGVTYTFDPFGTLRLHEAEDRLAEANRGTRGRYGLSDMDKLNVLKSFGGSLTPWGGVRMPAPADPWFVREEDRVAAMKANRTDTAYGPTTSPGFGYSTGVAGGGPGGGGFLVGDTEFNGTISIQPKMTPMPDGQLWAPKSEMERMAYEVAKQAISKNNAEQRQPSGKRRRGRR
jgi:tape measure domain-containing protein